MVSNIASESDKKSYNLPPGEYKVVGWDADVNGKRLLDEICQIGAYIPSNYFSQYIMPHQNIGSYYRKRHNIRVVTLGRYRMLIENKSGKIIKSKSEISALMDFLQWLQNVKGNADGIILLSHDESKISHLLLEGLQRYNLLDQFRSIVKGFASSSLLAKDKCAKTVRSFSLQTLSKVLLDKEDILTSAKDRAAIIYMVANHLCSNEDQTENIQGGGDAGKAQNLVEGLKEFTISVEGELKELQKFKDSLELQGTLKPFFAFMLKDAVLRGKACALRTLLVNANLSYNSIKEAWDNNKKEGIEALLSQLKNVKQYSVEQLVNIVVEHFDPSTRPVINGKKGFSKRTKSNQDSISGSDEASTPSKGQNTSSSVSTSSPVSNSESPQNKPGTPENITP